MAAKAAGGVDLPELARYTANGLVATAVHYGVLTVNLQVLDFSSAGLANMLAAVGGITCSFLGNRYFVFRSRAGERLSQLGRFLLLYALIACLHGAVLFVWTDLYGLDYRLGFLIATFLQFVLSYLGNRHLVFRL